MPVRKSLSTQVLVPVLLLSLATSAGVLLLVGRTTSTVREDYDRLTLAAAASHVSSLLDLAVSELTAARLAVNPEVVRAKRATVAVSVRGYWSRAGLDGLILDGEGEVVTSSLSPGVARSVLEERRDGFFFANAGGTSLRCFSEPFPLWGWNVITVGPRARLEQLRPELAALLPLLALGGLALVASVLLVLWRNLRTPMARMVADVEADRPVRPSGLAELDLVGATVNSALARLRARTEELSAELERRHQTERSLQEKEARIRLLLDSTAEGIFGLDPDGSCTFCNPAALRMLGHGAQEELLGKNAHDILHHARADGTGYPHEDCPVLRTSRLGVPARVSTDVFWRKDGTSFLVEYWSCPILEGGVLRGAVVGFVDTTERTTLEDQLRQAQKMEAVGRLAGGIAHDFNNLLMAIVGNATLAREEVEDDSPAAEDLDQVLVAADKAAGLTRQILAFSRKRAVSLQPVDLNELVRAMGSVLASLLGEGVQVAYELTPEPLVAMADRAQLEQVLLNLWTNARDAMPGGGRLVIGTGVAAFDAQGAAEAGLDGAGPYARLTVSDSGVGMDEKTRQRIFEPFFTTKEQGKGTGLGLSIAYGIVKQHRGQIAAASERGRGTCFTVHLPLTAEPAPRPQPASSSAPPGGSETILMAEDNDQVRALAKAVLEGAGYRVLAARDGEEAVSLHAAHAAEIGLCLFDIVMPRLGGRDALSAIRRLQPEVRVVLMSGYAPEEAGGEAGDPILLAKPFVPRELLHAVREALDGRPPRALGTPGSNGYAPGA